MPCLFFYALLNAYRLVLVVVPAGLRAVLVLVVVAAGLRAVLVLVVGFVVGFVVVVAGLREVLVVVVCVRSSPALRIVTPEPLADTRLSNAYSGCC